MSTDVTPKGVAADVKVALAKVQEVPIVYLLTVFADCTCCLFLLTVLADCT
jgi:hypothetical protein